MGRCSTELLEVEAGQEIEARPFLLGGVGDEEILSPEVVKDEGARQAARLDELGEAAEEGWIDPVIIHFELPSVRIAVESKLERCLLFADVATKFLQGKLATDEIADSLGEAHVVVVLVDALGIHVEDVMREGRRETRSWMGYSPRNGATVTPGALPVPELVA